MNDGVGEDRVGDQQLPAVERGIHRRDDAVFIRFVRELAIECGDPPGDDGCGKGRAGDRRVRIGGLRLGEGVDKYVRSIEGDSVALCTDVDAFIRGILEWTWFLC